MYLKKRIYVSLSFKINSGDRRIINEDYFKLMKKTAYFINTARGGLIDEDALITSLQKDILKEQPLM